jgi:hypothetical protein
MSARRTLILALAALAGALPAPTAQAKGIARASVCGTDGCTNATARAHGSARCPGCSAEELMTALPGSAHPRRRAPYVRIVLGFGMPGGKVRGRERVLFSPALRLAARTDGRGGWAWFASSPPALAIAGRMARGVRPFPAATMPIDRRGVAAAPPARDAGADISLLGPGGAILAAALGLAALTARRRARRSRPTG